MTWNLSTHFPQQFSWHDFNSGHTCNTICWYQSHFLLFNIVNIMVFAFSKEFKVSTLHYTLRCWNFMLVIIFLCCFCFVYFTYKNIKVIQVVISCTNDNNVPFLCHTCGKAFDKILFITTFIRIGGVVIFGQLCFFRVMPFWCYFIFAVVKHSVFFWNATGFNISTNAVTAHTNKSA